MRVTIVETLEGMYRVEWAGMDHFIRTRKPFLRYRDAERFARQKECQLLIELMMSEHETFRDEAFEMH